MEVTPTPSNPKAVPLIFGFGNVLLDKVLSVGAEFLSKYDLEPNTTSLLTSEEDRKLGIFEELEKPDLHVTLCVGGCAANSLRVAQVGNKNLGNWFFKELKSWFHLHSGY